MYKKVLALVLAAALLVSMPCAWAETEPEEPVMSEQPAEVPTNEVCAEEITAEDVPVEEAPEEEAPAEEAPVEDTPAEEAPAEEAPVEETPVEETPAEETPAEEGPEEEPLPEDAPAGEPAEPETEPDEEIVEAVEDPEEEPSPDSCGTGLTWSYAGGVLTISGSGTMTNFSPANPAPWAEAAGEIRSVSFSGAAMNIGDYAFHGCTALTSISFPVTVTMIGDYAFACSGLTEVSLPGSAILIGTGAFTGCTSLTNVTAAEGVRYIGDNSFAGCTVLKTISLPRSTVSIGNYAFDGCSALETVDYYGSPEEWNGIRIGAFNSRMKNAHRIYVMYLTLINGTSSQRIKVSSAEPYPALPQPEREGYVFLGWFTAPLRGSRVEAGMPLAAAENHMLYARWEEYGGIRITKGPENCIVDAGQKAVFTVDASGSGLTYRWQYSLDGVKFYNSTAAGFDTAALTISGNSTNNGRSYRCRLTDSFGNSVTTNAAVLKLAEPRLVITLQPADVSAANGAKAVFTVAAKGNALSYQWQYSLDGVKFYNSTSEGAKTPELTIKANSTNNGRSYRCIVADAAGTRGISQPAKLSLKPVTAITVQPIDTSAPAGSTAVFRVAATGEGLSYQWQYSLDGVKFYASTLTGAKTAELSVKANSTNNGRSYRCVVKDASGKSVTSDPAVFTLEK